MPKTKNICDNCGKEACYVCFECKTKYCNDCAEDVFYICNSPAHEPPELEKIKKNKNATRL